MSNIIFSVNAVAPIFLIILLGMVLKKLNIVNDNFVKISTKVVFKVGLPVMIFRSVSKTNFSELFNGDIFSLVLFSVCGILAIFVYASIIAKFFIENRVSRGAFIQGVFRSNFVIIGYPLIQNIFGDSGLSKGVLLTAFMMPIFNILAVIILSYTSDSGSGKGIKEVILNIVKNPLIIAIAISLVFSYFEVNLPTFVDKTIDYLATLATPLALLGIGSFFSIEKAKKSLAKATLATLMKLVINPAIFVTIAYYIGFRGDKLGVLLVLFASPTAISSFVMAEAMDNDGDLAANIIILTTLFAVLTIFVGVFILKSIGAI